MAGNAGFDLDPVFDNIGSADRHALERTHRDMVMAHPPENRGCNCTVIDVLAHLFALGYDVRKKDDNA